MPKFSLFAENVGWEKRWNGMPTFLQEDLTPEKSITVHFESLTDMEAFAKLVGQSLSPNTRSLWYPEAEIGRLANKRFADGGKPVKPHYPIYIVSKGRWEKRLTSDHLSAMGLRHYIVVEEAERKRYKRRVSSFARVLVLDPKFKAEYDTCDDLGDSKSKGPGAARNFAWEHSIGRGKPWHWVMDDNIHGFFRLYRNLKTPCVSGALFRAQEDFVERYTNVGMAGPNYFMFASRKTVMPPYTVNTRIYSCNLIRNDLPYRWRGRYNEDTDLSLRMLKDGLATIQFNAFLQMKMTTQTMAGGNNDDFYKQEGTRAKSEMQLKLHPDVSEVVERWGRVHHYVDYRRFKKNKLILKPEFVEASPGADEYGMVLQDLVGEKWVTRKALGASAPEAADEG